MIEYITNIPVEKLKPFPNHPFQVRDDDSMRETVEHQDLRRSTACD